MRSYRPAAALLSALVTIFGVSQATAAIKCPQLVIKPSSELGTLGAAQRIDLRSTRAYQEAHADYPNLRPTLEYKDQTGTLILHTSSLTLDGYKYYRSLLKNLPPDVRTVLIGSETSYEEVAQFSFYQYVRRDAENNPLDKFLAVKNESSNLNGTVISRWVQDHMGRLVSYTSPLDGKEVKAMVTAGYRFGYEASQGLAKYLGVDIIHKIPSLHEWGNYTVIGKTAYMVQGDRIYTGLNLSDFAYTGVDQVVILPRPKDPAQNLIGIPHTDEFLIPLADDLVLTNVAEYKSFFEKQGLRSALLPSNADLGLDIFTYTNSVLVNSASKKIIFVPQFGQISLETKIFGQNVTEAQRKILRKRDKAALRVFQQYAEGYEIIPVDVPELTAHHFGGLHCATGICSSIPNRHALPGFAHDGAQDL